jgi:predicted dehydrogenase
MILRLILVSLLSCLAGSALRGAAAAPLRLAIVGLVHGHTRHFLTVAQARADVQIVGVAEPDQALRDRYLTTYPLRPEIVFADLERMLDETKPQAVAIFTTTFDHLKVVQACAARGIHAMMEKPFAVSLEHARAMADAAKKGKIELVVNYITNWFSSNHVAYQLVHEERAIGEIRKMVVHDGHNGRKPPAEFYAWLNDPVQNGGGVIMDFGCYGANLITWLMQGARPTSVLAVTQRFQPELWTNVEDEATIIVTYPKAQAILQPSWNWPFPRKDIEIYGRTGYVLAPDGDELRVRKAGGQESRHPVPKLPSHNDQAITYLAAIVRGEARSTGVSSVAINLVATEILDAAKESARTGRRVDLRATVR